MSERFHGVELLPGYGMPHYMNEMSAILGDIGGSYQHLVNLVIHLNNQLLQARKRAEEWRDSAILDSGGDLSEFKEHASQGRECCKGLLLPWEREFRQEFTERE